MSTTSTPPAGKRDTDVATLTRLIPNDRSSRERAFRALLLQLAKKGV